MENKLSLSLSLSLSRQNVYDERRLGRALLHTPLQYEAHITTAPV